MGGKRFQLVARLVVSIILLCQVVVPSLALTLNAPEHIYECEFATFSWDSGSPPYVLSYAVGAGGVGDTNGIGGEQNCAETDDTSTGCYIPELDGKSLRFTLTDGSNESATAWRVVESHGACNPDPTLSTSPPQTTDTATTSGTSVTGTTVKPPGDTATSTTAGSPPPPATTDGSPSNSSPSGSSNGSSGSGTSNGPGATPGTGTNTIVTTAPNGSVTTIVNGGGNGNSNGNGNGNGNGNADGTATRTTQPTAVPIAGNTAEDEDQVRISKKVIPAIVGTILGAFVFLFAFLCFRWKRRQWRKRRPVPVLPVVDGAHDDVPASATSSGNSAQFAQFAPRPLNLVTEMSSTGGHTLTSRSPVSPTSPLTAHRYLTQSQIRSQSQQSHSQSQFQLSPPSLRIPPPPALPPFAPRYHTLPDSKQRSPNRSPSTPTAAGNLGRTGAFPPVASTAHSADSHSMGETGSEYPVSSVQPPYTMDDEEYDDDEEQRPPYDGYTSYYGGETGAHGIDTHPNDHYDRQPYPYHFDLTPTSSTPFTTSIGTSQTGPSMSGGSNQASASLQVIVQKELDTLMRSGDARIHQDRMVPITYPSEQRLQDPTSPTGPISPYTQRTQQVPRLQVVNYDEEEGPSRATASTSKKALATYSSPPVRASDGRSNRDDSPAYSTTDPAGQPQQAAVGARRRDMEALADLVAARIARDHSPTSPSSHHAPGPPPSYA